MHQMGIGHANTVNRRFHCGGGTFGIRVCPESFVMKIYVCRAGQY
jgi:hypothetical protein